MDTDTYSTDLKEQNYITLLEKSSFCPTSNMVTFLYSECILSVSLSLYLPSVLILRLADPVLAGEALSIKQKYRMTVK